MATEPSISAKRCRQPKSSLPRVGRFYGDRFRILSLPTSQFGGAGSISLLLGIGDGSFQLISYALNGVRLCWMWATLTAMIQDVVVSALVVLLEPQQYLRILWKRRWPSISGEN